MEEEKTIFECLIDQYFDGDKERGSKLRDDLNYALKYLEEYLEEKDSKKEA